MNPTVVSGSLAAASKAWSKFQDYRQQKALESYALLEEAAAQASKATNGNSDKIFSEARKQAGHVTQAAHLRLERALEELKSRGEEAGERFSEARKNVSERAQETKKASKKAQKKATKAANRAARKAKRKKQRGKVWPVAAILALLSFLGGLFYFLRLRKQAPSEVPPRVEEFSGGADRAATGSTLVYSSVSEEDGEDLTKPESDLAEEGVVERDEALLGSIDEQLAALHSDEDGAAGEDKEASEGAEPAADSDEDASRVTDEREDEGKHRLQPGE